MTRAETSIQPRDSVGGSALIITLIPREICDEGDISKALTQDIEAGHPKRRARDLCGWKML
jgi:hypothetical protein